MLLCYLYCLCSTCASRNAEERKRKTGLKKHYFSFCRQTNDHPDETDITKMERFKFKMYKHSFQMHFFVFILTRIYHVSHSYVIQWQTIQRSTIRNSFRRFNSISIFYSLALSFHHSLNSPNNYESLQVLHSKGVSTQNAILTIYIYGYGIHAVELLYQSIWFTIKEFRLMHTHEIPANTNSEICKDIFKSALTIKRINLTN